MSETFSQWQTSDALVLFATLHREGATVKGIISFSDYVNCGYVSFEEMHHALSMLISGGYVQFQNGHFRIEENWGRQIRAKLGMRRGPRSEFVEVILPEVFALAIDESRVKPVDHSIFNPEMYAQALREYNERSKWLREQIGRMQAKGETCLIHFLAKEGLLDADEE